MSFNKDEFYILETQYKDEYKPVVPKWVGGILELDKLRRQDQYRGSLCSGKTRKEWDEWKYRYSRKLKYARLNGWIVEGD